MYAKLCKATLFAVLVLSLASATASQASAMTVTVSPAGAFTATGGSLRFIFTGTPTVTCTTSSLTGTLSSMSSTNAVAPVTALASPADSTLGNVLLSASGCTVSGLPITVTCTGTSNIAGLVITLSGVTPMRLTAVSCVFSLRLGSTVCTATLASRTSATAPGGVNLRYTNTTRITIDGPVGGPPPTNQNLAIWNSGCTAFLPNGPLTVNGLVSGAQADFTMSPSMTVTAF